MAMMGLTGSRIRDRRLSMKIKQAELAKTAGVSASYLNLIEHNRRRIGGKLLVRIAEVLQVEPAALSEGADAILVEGLRSVASHNKDIEADRIEEFVARFPGWAGKLAAQSHQIEALEQTLHGLNDRLTHDPVLSEKMHDVLGAVSAIRSTSSILVETPNIDADWRSRFHANIDTESRRLAETSAAMVAHFDRLTRDDAGFSTALEAVSAFFELRQFHVRELEDDGHGAIDSLVKDTVELSGVSAQRTARAAFELYADDAKALPLDEFTKASATLAYEPAQLAQQFAVDLPTVFRRLATLPRSPDAPEIGLVSCDAAGAILLRKPPSGFSMPRFGAACPLWPLFSALRHPGVPERHIIESSEGAAFMAYSVAGPLDATRFDTQPVVRAYMLMVALDQPPSEPLAVGSTCRVCPRQNCTARRESSILTHSV